MHKNIGFSNNVRVVVIGILIGIVAVMLIVAKINKTAAQLSVSHISSSNVPAEELPIGTKEIVHGSTVKKEVIFTFDGGGAIQSADKILEALAKHRVKGTFFLTGKVIEAHPDLVRRIVAEGHEIFSHTYDHPDLTAISDDEIMNELEKTEKSLIAAANISPKPYFRAPYGERNARVLAVAAKAGYQSVYWTVDALDWKESEGKTPIEVKEIILSTVAPGNIYLMHLGDAITGAILDDVFAEIEARGYRIVSLTQGL